MKNFGSAYGGFMGQGTGDKYKMQAPAPRPMQPTLGTAIRGMFGGGGGPHVGPRPIHGGIGHGGLTSGNVLKVMGGALGGSMVGGQPSGPRSTSGGLNVANILRRFG